MPKCTRCGKTSLVPFGWGKYYADSGITVDYCPGCNKIFRNKCTQWEVRLGSLNNDRLLGSDTGENAENLLSLLLDEIQNDTKIHNFDYSIVISSMFVTLQRLKWAIHNEQRKNYIIG